MFDFHEPSNETPEIRVLAKLRFSVGYSYHPYHPWKVFYFAYAYRRPNVKQVNILYMDPIWVRVSVLYIQFSFQMVFEAYMVVFLGTTYIIHLRTPFKMLA